MTLNPLTRVANEQVPPQASSKCQRTPTPATTPGSKHTRGASSGKNTFSLSPFSDELTPRWGSPSPSELSEAGFYFTGPRDAVQCFSCETAQNQWKPAEDPWVRHGRRSPSCDYVIEMRGTDFVQAIIDSVEKVKNTLTTYTRTASNSSVDKTSPEFTKMKNGLLNTQVINLQLCSVTFFLFRRSCGKQKHLRPLAGGSILTKREELQEEEEASRGAPRRKRKSHLNCFSSLTTGCL